MTLAADDACYRAIAAFYGDRRAARSGVRLMKHLDEGLVIMAALGASEDAQRAYCLHPIVQDDDSFVTHTRPGGLLCAVPPVPLAIAVEYRAAANAFLSHDVDVVGRAPSPGPLPEVRLLLIADKVQNRADFERFHAETHERRDALGRYFVRWLRALDVDEAMYRRLGALTSA